MLSDDFLNSLVTWVQAIYGETPVPLHRPIFEGNERQYLVGCIDSNFVSSVGVKVADFEGSIASFTGSKYAVATVNGTAALHIALKLAGVQRGDEVITQALTFIATCNALNYVGAEPIFVDVDQDTLGMSPEALCRWLAANVEVREGQSFNRRSGRRIAACVPMHTFGFPAHIAELGKVCNDYGIPMVEDAAESLGSYVGGRHTGTFGRLGTLSFNGNKIITTGGGGMILTDDPVLAQRAKHLTTTAKVPHAYEFVHDEVGYNYRMPNLNAALGCAQLERLPEMLAAKSDVARRYTEFFEGTGVRLIRATEGAKANYWLNAIVLDDEAARDACLNYTNERGVMTRPIWRLMSRLEMYKHCQHDGLANSRWLEARIVNLPSSVPNGALGNFNG